MKRILVWLLAIAILVVAPIALVGLYKVPSAVNISIPKFPGKVFTAAQFQAPRDGEYLTVAPEMVEWTDKDILVVRVGGFLTPMIYYDVWSYGGIQRGTTVGWGMVAHLPPQKVSGVGSPCFCEYKIEVTGEGGYGKKVIITSVKSAKNLILPMVICYTVLILVCFFISLVGPTMRRLIYLTEI